MNKIKRTTLLLFALSPACLICYAQTDKPSASQASQAAPSEKPVEGEVDKLLKSLRKKGEMVVGSCREGATCQPLPEFDVNSNDKDKGLAIKVISKPQPVYPPIAKAARVQGAVVIEVLVDEEGKVMAAQVVSGPPMLQSAAVKAAGEARFSSSLLNGKPVKVFGQVTYHFVLR